MSQEQQQLSRCSRGRQASGFLAGGSLTPSQGEEFSLHSKARLLSDTACSASSRSQRQQGGALMKPKSFLPFRPSDERSSTQRTPVRSGGAGTPAAAGAASTPVFSAQAYHIKEARNEDGGFMSCVNGRHNCDCESLSRSPRAACDLTMPPAQSASKAVDKSGEQPNVIGTSSLPAAAEADLRADSHVSADSASTNGPPVGSSMTVSRNMPMSTATGGLTASDPFTQRPLSMSRRGAGNGSDGLKTSAGGALPFSRNDGAMPACAGTPLVGCRSGSLHTSSSSAVAKNTTTPPPPARLHLLPRDLFSSSTPAARAISPPHLSRRWNRHTRNTAAGNTRAARVAPAALQQSPSSQSICEGPASDVTSSVSTAPSAQGLTGAGSAGPLLVTPALSHGDSSTSPHQHLPLLSASNSSQSRAPVMTVAKEDSTESIENLSETASSASPAPRFHTQSPPLLQPGVPVLANASSPALADRHASSVTTAVDTLSVVQLHTVPLPLRNFGATCYLNAVVQCLLCTPGLLRTLDKDRQRIVHEWEVERLSATTRAPGNAHRRSCAERKAPATSSLIDLGTARPAHRIPVPQLLLSLKAACAACNGEFMSNGQNDAHEFLITLLGVIDREVHRGKPGSYEAVKDVEGEKKSDAYERWVRRLRQENNSTVYDFFGGVTGSTVKCASCQLISYRFAALLDISLPITYRSRSYSGKAASASSSETHEDIPRAGGAAAVDELLREMFFSERGEFLSGAMQVTCDRCKKLRDKTIWHSMEQWPPVLILHLKRFNNAGVKNEAAVVFPYTFRPFEAVKYQLYAICCHRGTSSYGHYTSYTYVQGQGEASAACHSAPAAAESSESSEPSWRGTNEGHAVSTQKLQDSDRANGFSRENGDGVEGRSEGSSRNRNGKADGNSWRSTEETTARAGRWYLCNDDKITEVRALDVLSMTKEAYILFYFRVDGRRARNASSRASVQGECP
ncbi:hypothetical protein LSCM1_00999 [Leishmania martiniquensis]|uniref:USP domain-containing protein n=1 Tax=Leishmania martiniquensis TaxID=1580590 RepID=A0A836KC33_9TRYP|nr:hypothetical protein LSCM1_00999 [Leishmania martiniquensis]